jgi:phosphorylcholine metabolism protein LicD
LPEKFRHEKEALMVGNIKLTGEHAEIAVKLLEDTTRILNHHKVKFVIDGGTLLGIVRENRLLPWDNDLDFTLFSDGALKIDDVLKSFSNEGYSVEKTLFPRPYKNIKRGDLRICKISSGKVFVDLIFKYEYEGNYYWMVWDTLKGVPLKFYENPAAIEFNGAIYPTPDYVEEYLELRYGDWKTPQKKWDIRKDDGAVI